MALALAWLLDTGRAFKFDYVGDAPLAPLSATFDANWFGSIATEGYSTSAEVTHQQNYHFFPLFPFSMRIAGTVLGLGDVPGGYNLAGVFVSHVFFLAALAALYWLTLRVFRSKPVASAAVWIAAFSPWSFVFSMAYTEALFLLLSLLAVLLAYEARSDMHPAKIAAAALLVTLAALTRPQGLVLAVPVVALLVTDGRDRPVVNRIGLASAVILPALVAVAGFVAWVGLHTGNMWALPQVNKTWGEGWLADMNRLFILPPRNPTWFVDVVSTTGLLIWAALVVYQVRVWAKTSPNSSPSQRAVRWAWMAYTLLFFAFTLMANPSNGGWGRYMITVIPNIWVVAESAAGADGRRHRMLLALSLTLQVLFLAAAVLLQVTP